MNNNLFEFNNYFIYCQLEISNKLHDKYEFTLNSFDTLSELIKIEKNISKLYPKHKLKSMINYTYNKQKTFEKKRDWLSWIYLFPLALLIYFNFLNKNFYIYTSIPITIIHFLCFLYNHFKLNKYYKLTSYIEYLSDNYYYYNVYLLNFFGLIIILINWILNKGIIIIFTNLFYVSSLFDRTAEEINTIIQKSSNIKIILNVPDQSHFINLTGRTLDEIPLKTKFKGKIIIDELILINKNICLKPKLIEFNLILNNSCLLLKLSNKLNKCKNNCCICYNNKSEMIITSCKHIFCKNCIESWHQRCQENNRLTTCPMCRKI